MTLIVTAILTTMLFINRGIILYINNFLNYIYIFILPREEDNDVNVSRYPKILINVRVNKLLSEIFFTLTATRSQLDLLALSIRNRIKTFLLTKYLMCNSCNTLSNIIFSSAKIVFFYF